MQNVKKMVLHFTSNKTPFTNYDFTILYR
jgi:hypothetical protein